MSLLRPAIASNLRSCLILPCRRRQSSGNIGTFLSMQLNHSSRGKSFTLTNRNNIFTGGVQFSMRSSKAQEEKFVEIFNNEDKTESISSSPASAKNSRGRPLKQRNHVVENLLSDNITTSEGIQQSQETLENSIDPEKERNLTAASTNPVQRQKIVDAQEKGVTERASSSSNADDNNIDRNSPIKKKKMAKGRHRRPLSSKYYPNPAVFEVNCVPFCEAFDLEGIMEDEELKQRYDLSAVDDNNLLRAAVRISPLKEFRINDDVRELFVFSDGVVVFWNWKRHEQDQLMPWLEKHFQGDNIDRRTRCEEEETMPFLMTYDNHPSRLHREQIMLNVELFADKTEPEKSLGPIYERFAFSHAMAASVMIGVWENRLDEMDGPITECIKNLKKGKFKWTKKEALQKIGDFVDFRHSMQSTELLSEDFYWERADLSRIYKQLCKNLCIAHRQNVMNRRLDYCEDMAKTIHEALHTQYSHRLEWAIIWLITLEVVIFLLPQPWIDKVQQWIGINSTAASAETNIGGEENGLLQK